MDIVEFFNQFNNKKPQRTTANTVSDESIFIQAVTEMKIRNVITTDDATLMLRMKATGGNVIEISRFMELAELVRVNLNRVKREKFQQQCHEYFEHLLGVTPESIAQQIQEEAEFPFTEDQLKGIRLIGNLLFSKELSFCLYGFAGTGKTTLITKLVTFLLRNRYLISVTLTAPTNKAKNVLQSKFKCDINQLFEDIMGRSPLMGENFTDMLEALSTKGISIEFTTVQRLLGYKIDVNNDGDRVFVRSGKTKWNYNLIVIDECSMLSLSLLVHLFGDIQANPGCRLLFVGDPAQLPPIDEPMSAIFAQKDKDFDYEAFERIYIGDINRQGFQNNVANGMAKRQFADFKHFILNQQSFTLEQVVRNNDQNVVGICNEVRKWVMGTTKAPRLARYKSDKVHIYKKTDPEKKKLWFQRMLYNIQENGNGVSNIILTWRNQPSNIYNISTREQIHGQQKLPKFVVGDTLILSDFHAIELDYGDSKDKKKRFDTSEQIEIVAIDRMTKRVDPFVETFPSKRRYRNLVDIKDRYIKCIKAINCATKRQYGVWSLDVRKMSDDMGERDDTVYTIHVVDDESSTVLTNDRDLYAEKIKELRDYYHNNHQENRETLIDDIIHHLWTEWRKKLFDPFAEVNYGRSVTCHKAQGSNYCNTFIDTDDMLCNHKDDEARKCIYTAMTRPTNELHILI